MIRFRTVASLFACSVLASGPLSAQGLWSKVPAFPTTCFNRDQFYDQAERAYQETAALARKQREANTAIDHQLKELDAATQQSRMITFMQTDPVHAGKFMQDAAMTGQRAQDLQADVDTKRKALKGQFDALQSQYKADIAKTTAYDQVCAKWWKASSPFLPYLADFRKFAVETWIPFEEFVAKGKRQQLDIMGLTSAGYKSPGEAEAVGEYLREAQKVFQLRFLHPAHDP